MDVFGCCSRYVECSDKRICVYAFDQEYAGCGYRKNLDAGRIFYGINAGKVIEDEVDKLPVPKDNRQDTSIFLHCGDFYVEVIDKRPYKTVENQNIQVSMFESIPEDRPELHKIIELPAKVKEPETIKVGSNVIAKDEYWGTYRGVLVGVYNVVLSDIKMAEVRIIDMLEPPRQDAILEKRAKFPRNPYPVGSVQVFYMDSCKEEAGAHESLCATG